MSGARASPAGTRCGSSIDVRDTGCTGYELAAALRSGYDIYLELATHTTLVLVLGLGQPVEPLERLAHDFAETVRRMARPGRAPVVSSPPASLEYGTAVPPRDAFLGASEAVPVADAVGRISCEAVAGYPPGVPALLPGERVTGEVIDYLRELTAAGARLHGAEDPTFTTLRVLRRVRYLMHCCSKTRLSGVSGPASASPDSLQLLRDDDRPVHERVDQADEVIRTCLCELDAARRPLRRSVVPIEDA